MVRRGIVLVLVLMVLALASVVHADGTVVGDGGSVTVTCNISWQGTCDSGS